MIFSDWVFHNLEIKKSKNSKTFQNEKNKACKPELKSYKICCKHNKAAAEKTKDKEFTEKEVLQTLESEKDCYNKYQFCLIYSRCQGMKFLILWKILPCKMFSNSI